LFKKPKGAYGFQFIEFPLAGELSKKRIDEYFKDPQTDHHLFFGIERPGSAARRKSKQGTTFDPRLAASIPAYYDKEEVKLLGEKVKWLHEKTEYAIVTGNFVGLVVTSMQFVMGYEDWYLKLALSPKELLYATEVYLENHLLPFLDGVYREIGPYIDVAYCVADDMATQLGPSFRLDLFRKYFKPMHKKIIETTKRHTSAKIMFHICGAAYPYLADLIEIGVDIINPVQNNAAGMEEERLKRDFGRDLSFWGAIDTQNVLSTGSREQVVDEVRRKIEVLGKDGGYIFSPCHDIQRNTPLENVIAMYETAIAQQR
jgi:uroporphyrinogen decarboxylase